MGLGNFDDDIVFTYGTGTEVDASCAATLNNEFWVMGGTYKRRQVIFLFEKNTNHYFFKLSKVEGCKLSKVGELHFDYYRGGCNTFSFGILLCFSETDTDSCHS